MAGKGDKPRPKFITKEQWDENFTGIDWSKHKNDKKKEEEEAKTKSESKV